MCTQHIKQIVFGITDACNETCKHCFQGNHPNKNELSFDTIKDIIGKFNDRGLIAVSLYGGEPTLHKGFFEIFSYMQDRFEFVDIYTNGVAVDLEKFDKMKRENTKIFFSLEAADKDTYSVLRNPKFFDTVLDNVRKMKEMGFQIGLNTILHEKNLDTLEELFAFASDNKLDEMVLDIMLPIGNALELDILIKPSRYYEINKTLQDLSKKYGVALPPKLDCSAGDDTMYIDAEGNLCICTVLSDKEFQFGNIYETDVLELWDNPDNEYVTAIRAMFAKDRKPEAAWEACKDCPVWHKCHGGCRSCAYYWGDDFYGIDPTMCAGFFYKQL